MQQFAAAHIMRKILFLTPVLLFAACSGSRHSHIKRLPGTWQESKVTIDGSNKDWPSPYPEYDDKAALGYCVSNDRENLYITVETGDPATQLKIIRNGLTVWIDKTGGREEATAINFPIPQPTGEKQAARNKGGGSENVSGRPAPGTAIEGSGTDRKKKQQAMEDRVRRGIEMAQSYSLQGFKACNLEFPLMERDSCGIIVRLALDDENEMVWEAVVPFRTFYYKKEIGRMDKGKPITVCFETTGSKRPAGQQQSGRHGGGFRPSVGMGGFGPMQMGMGGRGGYSGRSGGSQNSSANTEMESLYKDTKTYKTFGIAWVEPKLTDHQ
jgi:hypothetical protein